MFELVITYADGSFYWREYFNSLQEANNWLAIEKTRPYWQSTFRSTITDKTPPPAAPIPVPDASQISQIQSLRTRIRELANQPDLTAAEVKEAIFKFIKLLVLKREI